MSSSNRPSPGRRSTGASRKGPRKRAGKDGADGTSAKRPLTRGEKVRLALRYVLILGVVGMLVLSAVFYFAYRATEIPSANAAFQAQTTTVYYSNGKKAIGRFAIQNRQSIPLAEIPRSMQDAVVAAEDNTFWTNKGIDPKGILRAAFSNAQGNATQGASTITQQYVKILYLTQERTLKRKIKEAFLSLKIQNQRSKQEILEGYLNTIYFGRGAYGVEAAAKAYFGVPASKLDVAQSAVLASVLNDPNDLDPAEGDDARSALLGRYNYVLRSMEDMGTLPASEAAELHGKLPEIKEPSTSNRNGGQRGFMLDMVEDELIELGFDETQIETGGLQVITTLTRPAMAAARKAVKGERPDGLKDLHAASASIDVDSGALLGFFAGQDYLTSQLNWAKLGNSPGSAFKPFALAAGLYAGYSLKDTFEGNSPMEIGDIEIENQGEDGGSDYGKNVNLIKATESSINTAYVDLTEALPNGPQDVVDMAVKLGIPKDAPGLEANTTVALGSATVGVIDMANAYATFANQGRQHDWYLVKTVKRASDGAVLYQHKDEQERAISADIAADVTFALQQVVAKGSGYRARQLDRPAAGKTGTATRSDGKVVSSWFVGFTPQVSTAVMYTRGTGREPLDGYLQPFFGGTYPAQTWTTLMARMMDGVEEEDFPPAANVDGDAPDEEHEYVEPPPEPVANGKCAKRFGYPEDPDCEPPSDVCPDLPGDQPFGSDCNPPEPVANGACDPAFGYPVDPDCTPPDACPEVDGTQPPGTNCHTIPDGQCSDFIGDPEGPCPTDGPSTDPTDPADQAGCTGLLCLGRSSAGSPVTYRPAPAYLHHSRSRTIAV